MKHSKIWKSGVDLQRNSKPNTVDHIFLLVWWLFPRLSTLLSVSLANGMCNCSSGLFLSKQYSKSMHAPFNDNFLLLTVHRQDGDGKIPLLQVARSFAEKCWRSKATTMLDWELKSRLLGFLFLVSTDVVQAGTQLQHHVHSERSVTG